MCTVSFVPSQGKVIITSNRDEQVLRPALPPKNYALQNKRIFFPKDPKAGGTWYAVDDQATILVLLNGAEEKHQWNPPYRRSRGLIVLDVISAASPVAFWETIDLVDVEPFTLVLYQDQKLYQLRWNGTRKSRLDLDATQPYLWSSSTLYPKEIRAKRAQWFLDFLALNPEPTESELFDFHKNTNTDNTENGLVINRNEVLKTLSITQSVIEQNKLVLKYDDLMSENQTSNSFMIV